MKTAPEKAERKLTGQRPSAQIRQARVRSERAGKAQSHTTIGAVRRHPCFAAAKAGDPMAALELVRDLVKPDRVADLAKRFPNAVIVPVLAVEASGINMIPLAFAEYMASLAGWSVERGIVQVNRTQHTDAAALYRLLHRPQFIGKPVVSASYIVVDDCATSGATLQALRLHLEANGAEVVGVAVLAGSYSIVQGSSLQIAVTETTREAVEKKFGLQAFAQFIRDAGIAGSVDDITNSQARYCLSYRNLGTIRNSVASEQGRRSTQSNTAATFVRTAYAIA